MAGRVGRMEKVRDLGNRLAALGAGSASRRTLLPPSRLIRVRRRSAQGGPHIFQLLSLVLLDVLFDPLADRAGKVDVGAQCQEGAVLPGSLRGDRAEEGRDSHRLHVPFARNDETGHFTFSREYGWSGVVGQRRESGVIE